jgi:hypothetical protein
MADYGALEQNRRVRRARAEAFDREMEDRRERTQEELARASTTAEAIGEQEVLRIEEDLLERSVIADQEAHLGGPADGVAGPGDAPGI